MTDSWLECLKLSYSLEFLKIRKDLQRMYILRIHKVSNLKYNEQQYIKWVLHFFFPKEHFILSGWNRKLMFFFSQQFSGMMWVYSAN